MDPNQHKLILTVAPYFRHYVQFLLEKSCEFSYYGDPIQVFDLRSCSPCLNQTENADRFKLKIPYARQFLTWEILFDVNNWKEPPDFIFDDEDDFYPSLDKIHSYICWDWKNRESLVALVTELLDFYKDHQLERASDSINLQRQFRSLLAESPKDVQVIVSKTEKGLGAVNVLIKMEVNFESWPPYLIQARVGPCAAILHAYLPNPDSPKFKPQLSLSPSVENAFGGSHNLHIPVVQHSILLGEYFLLLQQLLVKQTMMVSRNFEKKKDLISAFLSHFGKAVVEYDVETFSKIVLLFEWNDFFFIFTVKLPYNFPDEQPSYIFRSVYHIQNRQPYSEVYGEFPYSPRWSGNEMAKRTLTFIFSKIKDFQKASVNNSDR